MHIIHVYLPGHLELSSAHSTNFITSHTFLPGHLELLFCPPLQLSYIYLRTWTLKHMHILYQIPTLCIPGSLEHTHSLCNLPGHLEHTTKFYIPTFTNFNFIVTRVCVYLHGHLNPCTLILTRNS